MLVVPPGHKVFVCKPGPLPRIERLECGIVLVDFGTGTGGARWRDTFSALERAVAKERVDSVCILQSAIADHLDRGMEIDDFCRTAAKSRAAGWRSVWVLPDAAASSPIVPTLKAAGFEVHRSADDGACFIEVHRPDGSIVTGMTGPEL